jgi:hypothetical protein
MSMVELSDHGDLLRRFLSLRCPRMFMYGEQNEALSYLPKLREHGVRTLSHVLKPCRNVASDFRILQSRSVVRRLRCS